MIQIAFKKNISPTCSFWLTFQTIQPYNLRLTLIEIQILEFENSWNEPWKEKLLVRFIQCMKKRGCIFYSIGSFVLVDLTV